MMKMHAMRNSQSGFSMVELMVAAVIGLIGCVVIFQIMAVFESQKRTTTSGGDAQSNLALAMHIIERDARQSGFGVNDPAFFGCTVNGWDTSGSGTAFTLSFVPALITQGATATDPDTLSFLYGSSQLAHFPPTLVQTMAFNTDPYRVSNRHGFELGDVLVVAGFVASAPTCTVAQVQSLPTAVADSNTIGHVNGSYLLSGVSTATRFNNSGGLGPLYVFETTKIFNLGRTPTVNTYSLINGQLNVQKFRTTAPAPIIDGIVQMQAQYGIDTGSDNIVDVYQDAPPADWSKVISIRLALVARVSQYEKAYVSPSTIVMWSGGPTWTLTDDERHFRYRILDTVIPLRNMIWRRPS